MPVSSRSLQHVFALKKQTNVQTAVADANVDFKRGSIEFAPFRKNRQVSVNDQPWYGRGTNFASFNELLHQSYLIDSISRACTDLDLIHAASFVMGENTVTQADPVGKPTQFTHTIKWVDVGTSPEVDYTTFGERMGTGATPGHDLALVGAFLNQFNVSGTFGDFVQISFEGAAREIDLATTIDPSIAVTAAHLFNINRCTMTLDNAGGGPTNIDGQWVGFDLTFNQNPDIKLRSGQPVGEEELIERADRGDQTLTGSITIEFKDTDRARFLNETEAAITIGLVSKDTVETDAVTATITIPNIVFQEENWSEEGRTALLTLNLDEASVLEKSGNDPVTIAIISDVDGTEILQV